MSSIDHAIASFVDIDYFPSRGFEVIKKHKSEISRMIISLWLENELNIFRRKER